MNYNDYKLFIIILVITFMSLIYMVGRVDAKMEQKSWFCTAIVSQRSIHSVDNGYDYSASSDYKKCLERG